MKNLYTKIFCKVTHFLCLLTFIFFSHFLFAQTFDYARAWGTYYGPAGTDLHDFKLDTQYHLNLLGVVQIDNSLTAPYYNQYVTAGGQNVNMAFSSNYIFGTYNNTGSLLTSDYLGGSGPNNVFQNEYLVHIDAAGDRYYVKSSGNNLTDAATSTAWLTSDPITSAGQVHSLLYKKNASGNIVWKTYLPGFMYDSYGFASDENSNLFVYGLTKMQQGITTSGVFKENYQVYYNNGIQPNAFAVQLGQQGQLLWGTYLPTASSFRSLQYHNQKLYLLGGGDLDNAINQLATSNVWQTSATNQSLTTLNSQNGMRVWGTYIGSTSASDSSSFLGIQANETGIYISGVDLNYGGTATNYYATPGAYKTQITGDTDYYLTKLDLNGNRLWGTYFGSSGYEHLGASYCPITLTQNAVFLVGSTWGVGSNISTPGSYQDSPVSIGNQDNNMFFAQFDLNGNLNWCSYYGGVNNMVYNQTINIVAPDHSTFYLYGSTRASTGIATAGASQAQLPQNLGQYNTGFVARFNYTGELSTNETSQALDLVLYDNPNNGNFTISGNILEKQKASLSVFDMSGKLVHQTPFEKKRANQFNLQHKLTTGNYLIEVKSEKDEKLKVFKMTVN